MCHTLIEGNYTEKVYLRRGDEMQNLAKLINDVIRTTDERLAALRDAKTDDEKNKIVSSIKI
jgi:signal transduction histidine kinase